MKISDAIKHFDTAADLARAINVTRSAVAHWVRDDEIPMLRQYQIEVVSGGVLRADVQEDETQDAA